MTQTADANEIHELVSKRWPRILSTLTDLARIPSVSWSSFDPSHVVRSAEEVAACLRNLNVFESVDLLRSHIAGSTDLGQPAVVARRMARNGAPTVLLYAHHDVQPPGVDDDWITPAFEPVERDGRLYGRGTADDKAGIVSHLASIELLAELAPSLNVGLVVFIEGEEEFGSPSFENFLADYRERLQADVIVVADSGNWSTTIPALTVSLRGNVTFALTVRTLDHGVHSGMFGGVAPDAMMAASLLVSSFYDKNGTVAIEGLTAQERDVPTYDDSTLRDEAGLLDGVSFIGTGAAMHRLWSQPAVTVTGIDAPPVASASNTLLPSVRLRISVRVAPGQAAEDALSAVQRHIERHTPFGAHFTIDDVNVGEPFLDSGTGPAAKLVREAMRSAWGSEPVDMGVGGSIPFIATFKTVFPEAEVLVTGVEDPDSRAHGTNESLHLDSLKKAIVTQTLLLLALNSRGE